MPPDERYWPPVHSIRQTQQALEIVRPFCACRNVIGAKTAKVTRQQRQTQAQGAFRANLHVRLHI
jgi:hypothetical protein